MKITPRLAVKLSRDWLRRRWRRRTVPHGVILMYHRIAAPAADPWKICVSPDHFAGHLRELTALADVVPLTELPSNLRAGRRSRPVVAITFDDAYLDNLTTARPILAQHAAPATVFVPTGWVGSPDPHWWDLLAHAVLASPRLPDRVDLNGPELNVAWRNPDTGSGAAAPADRQNLHQELWSQLRLLDDAPRRAALHTLMQVLDADPAALRDVRVMTRDELHQLAADGLVTLGSHAITHPSLPALSKPGKTAEIEGSARQFEQLMGARPKTFAYPYGDLDAESVDVVAESGYDLACSTREDLVWPDAEPLLLPRLAVGNWSPREFRLRLSQYWFA